MTASVCPRLAVQTCEPGDTVTGVPPLQGAHPDAVLAGEGSERDLVLDVESKDLPAPVRVHIRPVTPGFDCAAAGS